MAIAPSFQDVQRFVALDVHHLDHPGSSRRKIAPARHISWLRFSFSRAVVRVMEIQSTSTGAGGVAYLHLVTASVMKPNRLIR